MIVLITNERFPTTSPSGLCCLTPSLFLTVSSFFPTSFSPRAVKAGGPRPPQLGVCPRFLPTGKFFRPLWLHAGSAGISWFPFVIVQKALGGASASDRALRKLSAAAAAATSSRRPVLPVCLFKAPRIQCGGPFIQLSS